MLHPEHSHAQIYILKWPWNRTVAQSNRAGLSLQLGVRYSGDGEVTSTRDIWPRPRRGAFALGGPPIPEAQ